MNKNFTITFWIKTERNPTWTDIDSEINFPPFTINEWIQVFFSKYWTQLKIYILHPELWYRKISTNIKKYLLEKTFIALTNTESDTNLYINWELVNSIKIKDLDKNLEIWDYVMVNIKDWDLSNIKVTGDVQVILPAKIKAINWNNITLDFFNSWEIKDLDKSFLVY